MAGLFTQLVYVTAWHAEWSRADSCEISATLPNITSGSIYVLACSSVCRKDHNKCYRSKQSMFTFSLAVCAPPRQESITPDTQAHHPTSTGADKCLWGVSDALDVQSSRSKSDYPNLMMLATLRNLKAVIGPTWGRQSTPFDVPVSRQVCLAAEQHNTHPEGDEHAAPTCVCAIKNSPDGSHWLRRPSSFLLVWLSGCKIFRLQVTGFKVHLKRKNDFNQT